MKIGLVPMSAKPYHAGHDGLVRIAADENDVVLLFVSTSNRKRPGELEISGDSMQKIWKQYIEPTLPGNVVIDYGGTPVSKVWDTLKLAESEGSKDTFTIYSDSEDISKYNESQLKKYVPVLFENGQVLTRGVVRGVETPDISGTKMREYLSVGNIDGFKKFLPTEIQVYGKEIFELLRDNKIVGESLLKLYIKTILENKI